VVCAFTSIEVVHHQALRKTKVKEVHGSGHIWTSSRLTDLLRRKFYFYHDEYC
jgi:hypothetical protein